ncbi:MAG: hypothetical protein JXR83_00605 [Deltaproteobacteria bacterium]|nr:hypothetical protein [Deltaproteobacteria bacterium]
MTGRLLIVGAVSAAILGCGQGSYRIILSYPDQAALDRAARVEVTVENGVGCAELLARTDQPELSFDAHGDPPALGEVPFGLNSFMARVRDADCLAFAHGCTETDVQSRSDVTVRILLAYVDLGGCRADEQCSGGTCLRVDASSDAAVGDGQSSDRPTADSAVDDGSEDDGSTGDGAVGDGAVGDGAAFDGAAPDAGQRDRAVSDIAGADRGAVDGASADVAADLDASGGDSAIPDGALPDTFVPCSAGARRCVDSRTLAICDREPYETIYPCATSCDVATAWCWIFAPSNIPPGQRALALPAPAGALDLAITSDTVIDTDHFTIGPVNVSHWVVTQTEPAPEIAVFKMNSFAVAPGVTVRVVGQRALAIAAATDVAIDGIIDLSATGTLDHGVTPTSTLLHPLQNMEIGGPGGFNGGAKGEPGHGPCGGGIGQGTTAGFLTSGSGGGGHGGAGGAGGRLYRPDHATEFEGGTGGAGDCVNAELVPLLGGSGGGGQNVIEEENDGNGDWAGPGGGGGGAIQISAGATVAIAGTAKIIAGGGGGGVTGNGGGAGGGAGGAILLEAPVVTLASGAVLAANGGGGASGDCN